MTTPPTWTWSVMVRLPGASTDSSCIARVAQNPYRHHQGCEATCTAAGCSIRASACEMSRWHGSHGFRHRHVQGLHSWAMSHTGTSSRTQPPTLAGPPRHSPRRSLTSPRIPRWAGRQPCRSLPRQRLARILKPAAQGFLATQSDCKGLMSSPSKAIMRGRLQPWTEGLPGCGNSIGWRLEDNTYCLH